MSSRLTGLLATLIIAMTGAAFFSVWKIDGIQTNLDNTNRYFIPTLKNLSLILGKLSAFQRTFDQSAGFKYWGSEKFAQTTSSKLPLRKMVEVDIDEIRRKQKYAPSNTSQTIILVEEGLQSLESLAEKEGKVLSEIRFLVASKKFEQAANLYTNAKQVQQAVLLKLQQATQKIDSELSYLQLQTEIELSHYQNILFFLLLMTVLFSLITLVHVQRWITPITDWIKVANEIAVQGIHKGISFPKIRKNMPSEISLLTSEFTRMGTTIIEREKTIHQQKEKLESLNVHLKEQNTTLRRLGGLNEKILNTMNSGLLVINDEGCIDQFNESFCEIFNIDRNKVLGRKLSSILSEIDGFTADINQLIDSHLDCDEKNIFRRIPFKESRFFNIQTQPLNDNAGKLVFFEEITDIVEAEEKLEHIKKLMLAGNMSSQVAHELRNPLNAMSLQLELLDDDISTLSESTHSAEISARIRTLSEQVQRLDRLTRKYLDFGRQVSRSRSNLNVNQLIESCLNFFKLEIQSHRIIVKLSLDPNLHNVMGDKDALNQVLSNLIKNSLDALGENKTNPELHIKTFNSGSKITVQLSDNGSGIPQSVKNKVFEPFVTSKPNGHGLGLSISRQICIEHEGELLLQDADRGATFEIVLPGLSTPTTTAANKEGTIRA